MKTAAELLNTPITNAKQADAYVTALHAEGKLYHFEDSPEDILKGNTDQPLFTAQECKQARARAREMFALPDYCPFKIALRLTA